MTTQQIVTTIIGYPLLGFVLYRAGKITRGVVQASGGIRRLPLNLAKLAWFSATGVAWFLFVSWLWVPMLLTLTAWLIGYSP